MIKAFLQKHKKTILNHVKLLSVIAGILLFCLGLGGAFGATFSGWMWVAIIVGALFGVYVFIYGMIFGPHPTGNGFD